MRKFDTDVNPAFKAWRSQPTDENLAELVRRLERFAAKICWLKLPDHSGDFEPLINGIVWRAVKKAEQFKDEARFSTWFYKIALNECFRYLRNFKARCEAPLEEELPANSEGLDARADLISILNTLECNEHLLFRMVAEGHDFVTIGQEFQIGPATARKRWSRLKRRLQNNASV